MIRLRRLDSDDNEDERKPPSSPDPDNDDLPPSQGVVQLHYYGRWYRAQVIRVVGKGAWARFRTVGRWGDRSWRIRWISPERNAVCLSPEWARRALDNRDIEYDTLGRLVDNLRAGNKNLKLDAGDFESQALANVLDRLAGRYVVDRGGLPNPRRELW